MTNETEAIILDYLPYGHSQNYKEKNPIIQAMSTSNCTLFEIIPKKFNDDLKICESINMKEEDFESKSIIPWNKLTAVSKLSYKYVENKIKEKK